MVSKSNSCQKWSEFRGWLGLGLILSWSWMYSEQLPTSQVSGEQKAVWSCRCVNMPPKGCYPPGCLLPVHSGTTGDLCNSLSGNTLHAMAILNLLLGVLGFVGPWSLKGCPQLLQGQPMFIACLKGEYAWILHCERLCGHIQSNSTFGVKVLNLLWHNYILFVYDLWLVFFWCFSHSCISNHH